MEVVTITMEQFMELHKKKQQKDKQDKIDKEDKRILKKINKKRREYGKKRVN